MMLGTEYGLKNINHPTTSLYLTDVETEARCGGAGLPKVTKLGSGKAGI